MYVFLTEVRYFTWQLPVALKSPPPVEGELDPPMRPPGAVISGIA